MQQTLSTQNPSETRIGSYRIVVQSDRLEVRRQNPLLCRWLGREPRPVVRLLGHAQLGEVEVSRRRLPGPERKQRHTARPYQVRLLGADGASLSRALRFRSSREAEDFAALARRFRDRTP